MKKLGLLIVALLVLAPSLSFAKVGTRNLDEERKAERICMQLVVPVVGTDTTTGTDGIIATIGIGTGETTPTSSTTDLPTFPYAAKITFDFEDDSSDSVHECDSIKVRGITQEGAHVTETVGTGAAGSIDETGTDSTTNVFSQVTKIWGVGCSCDTGCVNDHLVAYLSLDVGVGMKINSYNDIESACIYDNSAKTGDPGVAPVLCAAPDNGTAQDLSSTVNVSTNSILASTAQFGDTLGTEVAAADNDRLCITVRPNIR